MDNDHSTTFTVGVGLLHTFLQRVAHHRHVLQIDVFVGVASDHDVFHLIRAVELAIHAHGVGLGAHVHDTEGDVAVLRTEDLGDGFDGEVVTLQLVGVAIDLDFTLRGAGNRDCTHAADT